ncbi:MAG: DUF2089 family protein [Elusimicrobiota bacterium]
MAKILNKIQNCCPGCDGPVKVREVYCEKCGLTLRGDFPPDTFSGLSSDEQEFVFAFVLNDGSIKDMARYLGKSYPTVRNMLDGIIHRLKDTRK